MPFSSARSWFGEIRGEDFLLLALVILATVGLYYIGLSGPFVFDDFANAPFYQLADLTPSSLYQAITANPSGLFHRPISNLSLAFNDYLFGPGPFSFKVINLLIHLGCGLLILGLTQRLFNILWPTQYRQNTQIAIIVMAFWLLHPIQVSTVLYTVQRMAQLSALFTLLAVILYVEWRQTLLTENPRNRWKLVAGILITLVAAVLSKENGALIPLFLLVLEGSLFHFRHRPDARPQFWAGFFLMVGIPILVGALLTYIFWEFLTSGYHLREFTLYERLLTEIKAIWHYLGLITVPRLSEMGLYYDDFSIVTSFNFETIARSLGIIGLFVLAGATLTRLPLLCMGILWFFAAHALESTFLPLEPAFEHRNYIALLGPAIIFGCAISALYRYALQTTFSRTAIPLAVLVLFALQTHARTLAWSTEDRFHLTQYANHPESSRAQTEMVGLMLNKGRMQAALQHTQKLEQLDPGSPLPAMLGLMIACELGRMPEYLNENATIILARAKRSSDILYYLEALIRLTRDGKCDAVTPSNLITLIDAIDGNSSIVKLPAERYKLFMMKALLHARLGERKAAEEAYGLAAQSQPDSAYPLLYLANYHLQACEIKDAERILSKMISGDGSDLSKEERRLWEIIKAKIHRAKILMCKDKMNG